MKTKIIVSILISLFCRCSGQYGQFVAFSYAKAAPGPQPGFLSFSRQLVNYNACFKAQYGAFIALQPGLYFFTFSAVTPENDHFRISLKHNRNTLVSAYAERQGYQSASQSAMAYLTYNDTVYLKLEEGNIYESSNTDRSYTSFSGYLLQPTGPPMRPTDINFNGNVLGRPNAFSYQQPYPNNAQVLPQYMPGNLYQQQPPRESPWAGLFKAQSSSPRANFPIEEKKEDKASSQILQSVWPFEGAVVSEGRVNDFNKASQEGKAEPQSKPDQAEFSNPASFPSDVMNPCNPGHSDEKSTILPGTIGQPCSRR